MTYYKHHHDRQLNGIKSKQSFVEVTVLEGNWEELRSVGERERGPRGALCDEMVFTGLTQ